MLPPHAAHSRRGDGYPQPSVYSSAARGPRTLPVIWISSPCPPARGPCPA